VFALNFAEVLGTFSDMRNGRGKFATAIADSIRVWI